MCLGSVLEPKKIHEQISYCFAFFVRFFFKKKNKKTKQIVFQ